MLSKRFKSIEVDRRTWLHVPSGTHWSTRSDPHQVERLLLKANMNSYIQLQTAAIFFLSSLYLNQGIDSVYVKVGFICKG